MGSSGLSSYMAGISGYMAGISGYTADDLGLADTATKAATVIDTRIIPLSSRMSCELQICSYTKTTKKKLFVWITPFKTLEKKSYINCISIHHTFHFWFWTVAPLYTPLYISTILNIFHDLKYSLFNIFQHLWNEAFPIFCYKLAREHNLIFR